MRSKGFIDTEYESGLVAAETEVDAHVHAVLELPSVADASIGQHMGNLDFREAREERGGANPAYDAVASPYVLAELDTDVGLRLC